MGGSSSASATMPSLQPMPGISQEPARVPTNAAQQIGTPGNPATSPINMQWSGYAPWLMAPWGSSAYGFQQPQPPINQTPLMWGQQINQLPFQQTSGPQNVFGGTPQFSQQNTSESWQTGKPGPAGPAQYIQGVSPIPNDPLSNWVNNVNVYGMHQGIQIPGGILGNLGGVSQSQLGVYL